MKLETKNPGQIDTTQKRKDRNDLSSGFLRSLRSFAVIITVVPLISLSSFGANVTLTVNPPIISLGESAQIKVEIRDAKRPERPTVPRIKGLRLSGTRQSTQTRIINGRMDRSISYSINATPQRTGEFIIGPFNYKVDGEVKRLSGKLKVVGRSGGTRTAQKWSDVVFTKITSSRDKTYVQEPFKLTLSIYSRPGLQIRGIQNLRGIPKTGLSTTEWKKTASTREQIDGDLYDVRHFNASVRPLGSGPFEFAPAVTVQIAKPKQQRRDSFFGGLSLFDRVQTVPVELKADAITVNVRPLPASGKPNHFNGAVGRFTFQVTADPKEVTPGDPITLQMTIIGEGNVDRILPPTLPTDAPFRLFGDAVRKQGNNKVRFEQVISPRDASVTNIPPIAFSFFDSEADDYRTIQTRPIPLDVTASSNNTARLFVTTNAANAAPTDTPFASESDLQRMSKWLKQQWRLIRPRLWTLPVALGLGIVLFLIRKIHRGRRKDTARVRRQQAPKAARKALKNADTAIRKEDTPAFYEAMGNALASYFGNRLNLPPGDVTPTVVLDALNQAGAETQKTRQLFEQVEAARYGLSGSEQSIDGMNTLKGDLERLLKSMEKVRI